MLWTFTPAARRQYGPSLAWLLVFGRSRSAESSARLASGLFRMADSRTSQGNDTRKCLLSSSFITSLHTFLTRFLVSYPISTLCKWINSQRIFTSSLINYRQTSTINLPKYTLSPSLIFYSLITITPS